MNGGAVKVLGLQIRLEELSKGEREFAGELDIALLEGCLPGLVGELGYRVQGPAQVTGRIDLSASGELIVNGGIVVSVGYDCSRCLEDQTVEINVNQTHVLVEAMTLPEGRAEVVVSDEDEGDPAETYSGDEVDLVDLFRQDLVLAMPMNPSCDTAGKTDCPYDAQAAKRAEETIDPRWAPLAELRKKLE